MLQCHSCGVTFELEGVYRSTVCPSCGKEVKVCLNCRFYAPGAHWDCRETIPEPVRDKDRANFCDYFKPAPQGNVAGGGAGASGDSGASKAKDSFDKLFGD